MATGLHGAARTAPRITICGILELGEHSAAGVTHVLSILGPNGPDPPEFAEFAPHRRLVLRFHDVIEPLPDQIAPTRADVERLLVFGREVDETPDAHLLVHCHAGVSRSTAAATLIMMQANPEWPPSAALEAVAALRRALQAALGDRVVLPLGQANPQDSPLSRHLRKCRAHPDRRRTDRVSTAPSRPSDTAHAQ